MKIKLLKKIRSRIWVEERNKKYRLAEYIDMIAGTIRTQWNSKKEYVMDEYRLKILSEARGSYAPREKIKIIT